MDSMWSSSPPDGLASEDRQNQACSSTSMSIAEMIAQTANEFISEQVPAGFTYCAEYGTYYNPETGYYYDSTNCLFYHPNTQCYYRYNHQSNSYETIPTTTATNTVAQPIKWVKKKSKKRARKVLQREGHELDQLQVDVLECLFEVVDKCAFLAGDFMAGGEEKRMQKIERRRAKGIERIFKMAKGVFNTATEDYPDIPEIMTASATYNSIYNTKRRRDYETMIDSPSSYSSEDDSEAEAEELRRWQIEEESSRHGACVRLIETNASSPSPPILHIITITGATIGFGSKADIQLSGSLPTNNPVLFAVSYVQDEKEPNNSYYQAKFSVSQIKLNDTLVRMDPASNTQPLKHEDKISFGSHVLLFHLHNGLNTCPGCEPGLFPASQIPVAEVGLKLKPKSRDAQRRQNNRLMKEQYGLLDQDDDMVKPHVKYTDRAHKRRKEERKVAPKQSSVNPIGGIYANCLAAPQPGTSADSVQLKLAVDKPADTILQNGNSKGLQLLKGMGWKEGQGLGKNKQGIQEPIVSTLKANRSGFGLEPTGPAKTGKISIQLSKSKSQMEKESILEKTRLRYQQAEKNT